MMAVATVLWQPNGARLEAAAATTPSVQSSKRTPTQVYNVKSFGAKGDGHTDDTQALHAALQVANANPGSAVFFPAGNYLYSSNLAADSITVYGQRATLTATSRDALELTGDQTTVRDLVFAGSTQHVLELGDGTEDGLTNFHILNNKFTGSFRSAIYGDGGSNGSVQSNRITETQGNGIDVQLFDKCSITDNIIDGGGSGTGIHVRGSTGLTLSNNTIENVVDGIILGATRSTCSNNEVTLAPTRGSGSALHAEQGEGINNCKITNNEFFGNGEHSIGADLTGSGIVLSKNSFRGFGHAVVCGAADVQIESNQIDNVTDGIEVIQKPNVTVEGNTIKNAQETAIQASGASNFTLDDNKILIVMYQGIKIEGGSGLISVSNNTIQNCGLSAHINPAAVIYVDSDKATNILISENVYTGFTKNLQYYIRCVQPEPPADVFGNKTSTMLPTLIGP
jgi:parallel beta-helix repeat protein